MPNNELSISLIDYGIPETYADLEKVTETMQNLKRDKLYPNLVRLKFTLFAYFCVIQNLVYGSTPRL